MSMTFDEPRPFRVSASTLSSDDAFQPVETLEIQLEHRGIPHDVVDEVVGVLRDIAPGPTTLGLTASELEFTRAAGIPDEVFSVQAQEENALYEAASAVVIADEYRQSLLPTSEVAKLLGKDAAHIRRMLSDGRLMAVGQVRGQSVYPKWQFVGSEPLPGLREVLAAFPDGFHPLDVEKWMTTPLESLGGRSPHQWLATGGPASRVAELADDLGYL